MRNGANRKRIARAKAAGRLVDVYSDASHRGLEGAWAAVIVRADAPTVEASGKLRGSHVESELSELQAVGNALHVGVKAGLIRAGDFVVVRSDNLSNVHRIRSRKTSRDPRMATTAEAFDRVLGFAEKVGFILTAAHVSGHQPESSIDPHAVHNRRCDLLCKRIMGAKGGRGPVTIEEARRHAAVQSARAKRRNAARAIDAAAKLEGRA